MTDMESRNEILVMVLTDLAAICKKLAQTSELPESLRLEARQLGEDFDSLSEYRGVGTATQHYQGELLLAKIARFFPRILGIQAVARGVTR